MYKLIAVLNSLNSSLEDKTIEFVVGDSADHKEILQKLEPMIEKLRGENKSTLGLIIKTETGMTVLRGTVTNGFSGVVFY